MSTDPTQNGTGTGQQIPSMADLGQLMGMTWLNDYNQKLAVQRLAYAEACGQPLPTNAGISLTTNNMPPPATPAPGPTNGTSSLLKTAALAAGMAAGGAGLLGGGAILGNLFSKPPVIQPAAPAGEVTIGISDDGTLTP